MSLPTHAVPTPEIAAEELGAALAHAQAVHADQPELAAEALLAVSAELIAACAPAQRDELLRLTEHVLLGHLDRGAALADRLPVFEALAQGEPPQPASQSACRRSRAALQLADDASALLGDLPVFMQVLAHFNAALARTRRRDFDGAAGLLQAASQLAAEQFQRVPEDAQTARALAALANNLAGDLRYYHQLGDAPHAALMMAAAGQAREAWSRAGGWLELERADWQLAMCGAAAGLGPLAGRHAQDCLAACQANSADDFEFCFAWQAVALAALAGLDAAAARAARHSMAEHAGRLPEAHSHYARSCLAEIDARLAELA